MNHQDSNDETGGSKPRLAQTLLEMGELQLMLLRADAAAATKASYAAIVMVAVAVCLLIAAAPVLLLAAAAWIEEGFGLSRPVSLAAAGGAAAVAAALLLLAARRAAGRGLSMLSRTLDELAQNLESVKRGLADARDDAPPPESPR